MPTLPFFRQQSGTFFRILGAALLFLSAKAFAFADPSLPLSRPEWTVEEVAPGVRLFQRHFEELFGARQFVNVLVVERDAPGIRVAFAAASLLGEFQLPTSEIGERSGALAASNGGFAHGGPEKWNSGILKIDGVVHPFLKIEPEELRFVGSGAVGIDAEDNWHFREREDEAWEDDWPEMVHALAGGHLLLADGELHRSIAKAEFISPREERHAGGSHPRTALARKAGGEIALVTVDGRHPHKAGGMTLTEFAVFLQSIGAIDALNLDGGGSTTMWVREKGVVSRPSNNRQFDPEGERLVRTAVVIVPKE